MMPSGKPPHKEIEDDPGLEHRYEMSRLVADEEKGLEVSRIELDRDEVSYTFDTLQELSKERGIDLVLVLGGDQAAAFPDWHRPEAILDLAELAVAERQNFSRDEISGRLETVKGGERTVFFDMPGIEVSSSMVRERVKEGHPIRHLVPGSIEAYIEDNCLYSG